MLKCVSLLFFNGLICIVFCEDCIIIGSKSVVQQTNTVDYFSVASPDGSHYVTNAYDGNEATKYQTVDKPTPDNNTLWLLLRLKDFSLIRTVTINSATLSNFSSLYFLGNSAIGKTCSKPSSLTCDKVGWHLTTESWNNFKNFQHKCSKQTDLSNNITLLCDYKFVKPVKYMLIVFDATSLGGGFYHQIDINEVYISVIDINTPIGSSSPSSNWKVSCSNSLSSTCNDYVICNNNKCWNSSIITNNDILTTDNPTGPYHCVLSEIRNQSDYGISSQEFNMTWFPAFNESLMQSKPTKNPNDQYNKYRGNYSVCDSDRVVVEMVCTSDSSLPVYNHSVSFVNTKSTWSDPCSGNITTDTKIYNNGSFGSYIKQTFITLTWCKNVDIDVNITCESSQLTVDRNTMTETYTCDHSVNGNWSEWSSWSSCACPMNETSRTRKCNNPPPAGTGSDCAGNSIESQLCNCTSTTTTSTTTTTAATTTTTAATTTASGLPPTISSTILFNTSNSPSTASMAPMVVGIIAAVLISVGAVALGVFLYHKKKCCQKVLPDSRHTKNTHYKKSINVENGHLNNNFTTKQLDPVSGSEYETFDVVQQPAVTAGTPAVGITAGKEFVKPEKSNNVNSGYQNDEEVHPSLELTETNKHPPPQPEPNFGASSNPNNVVYAELDKSALNRPPGPSDPARISSCDTSQDQHIVYADIVGVLNTSQ